MPPKNKLRFGVLGCAAIAQRMTLPAMHAVPEIDLVAVASRDGEKARKFAGQFGCEAMTGYEALLARPDIDAVYLPLPPALHEDWAIRALKAGKHVLCEKPAATGLRAAKRMATAAEDAKRLLSENFMFLAHRQMGVIEEIAGSGRLGELRLLRATFGFPPLPAGDIRYRADLGGGALLDAGCYTLRAAQHFLGDGLDLAGAILNRREDGLDIAGSALLRDRAGRMAQLAFGFDLFYQCELQLLFTRGRITAPRIFTAPPAFSPEILVDTPEGQERIAIEPHNHFAATLQGFALQAMAGATGAPGLVPQAELVDRLRSLCPPST